MLDIIKTGSSMIPVPMVQPLIGVVAGFLHAADVSCTFIIYIILWDAYGFIKQACNNFEWMRWLSTTAAECVIGIAMRCPEKTEKTEQIEQTKQTEWAGAIETLQKWVIYSPTGIPNISYFFYRKLSDIVQQAEVFCLRSVVSRFLQQGCDKGAIEMMKEDLKAAIGNFNVRPFH